MRQVVAHKRIKTIKFFSEVVAVALERWSSTRSFTYSNVIKKILLLWIGGRVLLEVVASDGSTVCKTYFLTPSPPLFWIWNQVRLH